MLRQGLINNAELNPPASLHIPMPSTSVYILLYALHLSSLGRSILSPAFLHSASIEKEAMGYTMTLICNRSGKTKVLLVFLACGMARSARKWDMADHRETPKVSQHSGMQVAKCLYFKWNLMEMCNAVVILSSP